MDIAYLSIGETAYKVIGTIMLMGVICLLIETYIDDRDHFWPLVGYITRTLFQSAIVIACMAFICLLAAWLLAAIA